MQPMTAPDELGNGLFGKIPSRGDFLRVNVTGSALDMARYLDDVVTLCHRAGVDLEPPPTSFIYRAPAASTVVVGVLAPSVDNVGRRFPLSLYTQIEVESAAGNFDIVPFAFASFFEAAAALAGEGEALDVKDLEERLFSLPFPDLEEFAAAQERGDALLLETTIGGFCESLFGAAEDLQRYFALHTLATACFESRELLDDTKPGITLDLPLIEDHDAVIWLGMVRRLLGEQAVCPNVLWTPPRSSPSYGSVSVQVPPVPGRLLVSFGAPAPSALALLCGVPSDSPKLWPVSCEDQGVIDEQKALLTPDQLETLDDLKTPLDAVVSAFGG